MEAVSPTVTHSITLIAHSHPTLTASDRRILLANWFFKAVKKALEGDTKRKYFEHAGALLTADGTDDDLIKLEGTPREYRIKI